MDDRLRKGQVDNEAESGRGREKHLVHFKLKRIDAADGVDGVAVALCSQRLAVEPDAHALTGCELAEVFCYLFGAYDRMG